MGQHITSAPIEHPVIRQGVNYVRMPDGSVGVPGASGGDPVQPFGSAPQATVTPDQPGQSADPLETPAPAEPPRPLTPLETFHPSLDPTKVEIAWDEKTGKMKVIPREAAVETPAGDEGQVDDQVDEGNEVPDLGTPGQQTAAAQAGQPSSEIAELRTQLASMAQILTAVVTGQANGKSIAEVLGVQSQPAGPTPPDPTQFDLYDPQQLAEYHKQNALYNQAMIRQGVSEALQPHLPAIQGARQSQELTALQAKYGTDPNYQNNVAAAMDLMEANPGMQAERAYGIVSHIVNKARPQTQSSKSQSNVPSNGNTANGANKARQTTLTPEQAAAKAAQAAKLPQSSGVRGAGPAAPPDNIEGLGDLILWETQQASLGNRVH